MQRFIFLLCLKRSQLIFQLMKACVEKLLKFHRDFKVKYHASVRGDCCYKIEQDKSNSALTVLMLQEFS